MILQNKLDNIGINYCQYGEGEVSVVFIHGLFGCGRNWHTYLKYVHEKFSLIALAPDLRGQGESEDFFNDRGVTQLVDDMHSLIKTLCHQKVILIGHSLGGKIAISLAAEFPELFSKVMILDTGINPPKEDIFAILDWLKKLPVPINERREARQYFDELTTDQRLRNFLLTNLKKYDDGYKWRLDLDGLYYVVKDLLETELSKQWQKITAPIFLVRGKETGHFPIEEANEMCKENVTLFEIDDAGHWVHADNPTQFKEVLDEFLQS